MATFRRRADIFGQILLMEAEGQVRSAFADHPEWVTDVDLQWFMARSIGKRVAGQYLARWEQLSRVRRAVASARALDNEDGLATYSVIPSRRLKRQMVSASVPPKRQLRRASSKRQSLSASSLSAGRSGMSGRQEVEAAVYLRLVRVLGELAGRTRREAEAATIPAARIRSMIRHAALVDALRMLASRH